MRMLTLVWGPGDPLTPYHLHSFIRLDHILTPDTATPYHNNHQPRHMSAHDRHWHGSA